MIHSKCTILLGSAFWGFSSFDSSSSIPFHMFLVRAGWNNSVCSQMNMGHILRTWTVCAISSGDASVANLILCYSSAECYYLLC